MMGSENVVSGGMQLVFISLTVAFEKKLQMPSVHSTKCLVVKNSAAAPEKSLCQNSSTSDGRVSR